MKMKILVALKKPYVRLVPQWDESEENLCKSCRQASEKDRIQDKVVKLFDLCVPELQLVVVHYCLLFGCCWDVAEVLLCLFKIILTDQLTNRTISRVATATKNSNHFTWSLFASFTILLGIDSYSRN